MINYSEIIKASLSKSGLTYEQISEKMNVAKTTIQNWVSGKSKPDIAQWMMLYEITKNDGYLFSNNTELIKLQGKLESKQEEIDWYRKEIKEALLNFESQKKTIPSPVCHSAESARHVV